jgi:hypothetical protein
LAFAAQAAVESNVAPASTLSAAQIVEKNVAARGGLEAWRKIQTMTWTGHVENGSAAGRGMPFVLELKRPNKTRFEILALNQVSVRVYDGTKGWKLRPGQTGKPERQAYSADELAFAHGGQVIDGPLIDHQAKGIGVQLEGIDAVEGRKAYRLSVTLPSGMSHRAWIDAQTFLDIKYDRVSRNALGQSATVWVFYRDYQAIDGLQMPSVIEIGSANAPATQRMVIDKIALNPPLADRVFARPSIPGQRNGVLVDTRAPLTTRPTTRSAP